MVVDLFLQNGGLTMKMSFRQEKPPRTELSEMWQHLHSNRQFEATRELHLRHETSIQVQLLRLRLKTQIRPRFAHQNQTWQRRDSTAFPQPELTNCNFKNIFVLFFILANKVVKIIGGHLVQVEV